MSWLVVAVVGAVVLVVVFGLQLFSRLNDGQEVIDDLRPLNTADRVETTRGGVDMVSSIVDLADPLVLESGGAAGEVPELVAFVSEGTGLSEAEVLATLEEEFPRTAALLTALPLEDVTAELPEVVAFLAEAADMEPDEVVAAVEENFPGLAQSINALPTVTEGWDDVPDTPGTRFDGEDIDTVPDFRDYVSADVVPVLERQRDNYRDVDDLPGGVDLLPPLLTVVGIVVLVFGLLMAFLARRGALSHGLASLGWVVVIVVGATVLAVVFGFQLYPRLGAAQDLIDDAEPVFVDERVTTLRGGVDMVSSIVDLADPLVLESRGAPDEVAGLVAFASEATGLSEAEVLATLEEEFPRTTALLTALPLEEVNAEIPELVAFLSENLDLSEDEVLATVEESFPRLAQSIVALPTVTEGWDDVPGTPGTRFDGDAVDSVPQVRDFLSADVVPVVERQRENFQNLASTWPPTNVFPPLLTVVGVIVILYGLVMLRAERKAT